MVVTTLGLGIGANAAVFSAVDGLLLRASPFKDPDRLVLISTVRGDAEGPVSVPEFDEIRALPAVEAAARYTTRDRAPRRSR